MQKGKRSCGPSTISYNPGIAELEAIALIKSLPPSLTEIGMVECDLGDESGDTLPGWTQSAFSIRMMCVEGNG